MSLFSHDCDKGGHRIEGRYDNVFPKALAQRLKYAGGDIRRLQESVYVRDICVRCGKTWERSKA